MTFNGIRSLMITEWLTLKIYRSLSFSECNERILLNAVKKRVEKTPHSSYKYYVKRFTRSDLP